MSEAGQMNVQDIDTGPLPSLIIPCKAKEVTAPGTRWPGDTKCTHENHPTKEVGVENAPATCAIDWIQLTIGNLRGAIRPVEVALRPPHVARRRRQNYA